MTFVLASHNKNKIKEMRELLASLAPDAEVVSATDVGITEDIPETGSTFEENAMIKARAIAERGYIAVADDSGLCVDALGGAPGIYSARYSGGGYAENNIKLLAELKDIPEEKRTARFVSVIVCLFPDRDDVISVRGECEGKILFAPEGEGGFGYDPVFFCPDLGKSFASLSPDEKNSVSHRGRAMRKFAEEMKKYLV